MSATLKGGADLTAFLAALPANLERNVLRGALKAGADVIAQGARDNLGSDMVKGIGGRLVLIADSVKVSSKSEPGVVSATVATKGEGAYVTLWLEYGTDEHFISVDPAISGGRTARRVNRLSREGDNDVARTLIIGGKPVGKTVHHPGARPMPFMRPALDNHESAAVEAIGAHIAKKATKAGIETPQSEAAEE